MEHMRKALTIIVGLLALLVIGSCTEDTPRSVAEKSMQYLKDKEFGKYVDLVYFEEEVTGEKELLKDKKDSMRDLIQTKYNASVEENGNIKDFSFIDEEVKDSTALVRLQVNYTSGKSDTQKVNLRKTPNGDWRIYFKVK